MSAWYDAKTKQEIVSIKMFEKFEVSVALHSSCIYLRINKNIIWSHKLTCMIDIIMFSIMTLVVAV